MAIKLNIEGFGALLREIEKAGGNLDAVTKKCLSESAEIMQSELKTQMQESNVPQRMINAMPSPELEHQGNVFTARIGYKKGAYDPKNPSIGYKVVFLNYGTPNRTKHGKIDPNAPERGFIQRAKKRARPKIRKQQKEALQKALKGLKK